MQIKEVEKLTGLTAKAIRFYEDKGLLDVARSHNTYRDYSQENMETLRQIKVYRYLGFSISQIKLLLLEGVPTQKEILLERIAQLEMENEASIHKQDLCRQLVKNIDQPKTLMQLAEQIEFRESEEFEKIRTALLEFSATSLWQALLWTLTVSGPIITTYLDIAQGRTDRLFWTVTMSFFAVPYLLWVWKSYFKDRRQHRQLLKQLHRKQLWLLPIALATVILTLLIFVGVSYVQGQYLPDNWRFFEGRSMLGYLMIFVVMVYLAWLIMAIFNYQDWRPKKKQTYVWMTLLACLSIFLYASHMHVVTDSHLMVYSPLQPWGRAYDLTEIDQIHAYYGSRGRQKGQFFYAVEVDGQKIVFAQPQVNEKFYPENSLTYQELKDFDAQLVVLGVSKTASSQYSQYNDLDPVYQALFLDIIENK